jgi:hypothetical protein
MATITEDQMHNYLRSFHDHFLELVERYVPADLTGYLLPYATRASGLVGYISTTYGAGFEYVEDPEGIQVEVGSARIEDLLFRAPRRLRDIDYHAFTIDVQDVEIIGSGPLGPEGALIIRNYSGRPVILHGPDSSVTIVNAYFSMEDWHRYIRYSQMFSNRSAEAWSVERARERVTDELMKALVDLAQMRNRGLSLPDLLSEGLARYVLLLGSFEPEGRDRLKAIARHLLPVYAPLRLDEIETPPEYSLRRKVRFAISLSRFIVVEDSKPAGQVFELAVVAGAEVPTVILRREGEQSTFMTLGLGVYSKVIREFVYSPETLPEVLAEAIEWVEGEILRVERTFREAYPWARGALADADKNSSTGP